MTLRIIIAWIHLLTLCVGFYAIWSRARAFKKLKDTAGLPDVFQADNYWGIAAIMWMATGYWRAFGGFEKGTDYYLHSTAFWIKMSLFILVFFVELKPMITLVKWRRRYKKGETFDISQGRLFALLSRVELGLLVLIVLFATAVARGAWY